MLRWVAAGLSNADVAARLFFSLRTANAHLTRIYAKLEVGSKMEAVNAARSRGLLGD